MSGKLWMFSDQLDDEDLEFARHSFFRYADTNAGRRSSM